MAGDDERHDLGESSGCDVMSSSAGTACQKLGSRDMQSEISKSLRSGIWR
jgi:hypothetical protein